MKNLFNILILSLLIYSCSSSKVNKKDITYFDENSIKISKKDFDKKKQTRKFLAITIDSTKLKLTTREKRDTLNNMNKFIETLEADFNITLDKNKPIAIIFYPGEYNCNSDSSTRLDYLKTWYNQLEYGLEQVANIKPLYIYKNSKGLENYDEQLDWRQDPNQFIEKLFFKHHYPCSNSFVVISNKGDYISYLGEFQKEFLWEAAKILK